jgi:SAM-dependent methyltransferase
MTPAQDGRGRQVRQQVKRLVGRVEPLRRAAVAARFGSPRRVDPMTDWGYERGTPVDRWYLERWLRARAADVTGTVLEVKEDLYASALGAAQVDVVDIDPDNRRATIVGDLCDAGTLRPGRYDAAVVTQTLLLVPDPAAAVRTLVAALRPGGTLLLTVPCLSRLVDQQSDRWRWTPLGLRTLLEQAVPDAELVEVTGLGNGLAARALLFGLAAEDLDEAALSRPDPAVPLLAVAAVRRRG